MCKAQTPVFVLSLTYIVYNRKALHIFVYASSRFSEQQFAQAILGAILLNGMKPTSSEKFENTISYCAQLKLNINIFCVCVCYHDENDIF